MECEITGKPCMSIEGQGEKHKELEREAVTLWKQYRFLLPSTVRGFLLRLAAFLQWHDLHKELAK